MSVGPPPRILIVDDDPSIRRSLTHLLNAAGYEAIQAANGAEAVRTWRELNGGDLVILDMFMPEKDGIETIIELRVHSPGLPVIAMSGGGANKRVDVLGDAKLLGAVATIEKPFSARPMLALVARSLAGAQ